MSDDCIFCAIVAGEAPATKVYEDDATLAFLDIFPATDGHTLVIPKDHTQDLATITPQQLTDTTLRAQRIATVMPQTLGADGVNLLNCCGADAWQSVFHFHIHVIPRYAGRDEQHRPDSLRLPWRPNVPGDPELRSELGGKLTAALSQS